MSGSPGLAGNLSHSTVRDIPLEFAQFALKFPAEFFAAIARVVPQPTPNGSFQTLSRFESDCNDLAITLVVWVCLLERGSVEHLSLRTCEATVVAL